ncbi:50S ribosomal protein L35 [Arachnia propionica]|uniref:Large ribosomal subunit protein bL35 n=1 Tax=Arachnia propionica TaxID=1750 RepID=A0A3P1TAT5_9ACTN|nr:50S ribosomal protein L35 [Arachnia propionica]MDO5067086.1 50S ribosomal protein L35 [Propionibacteriaceae bacterium]MDO5084651.1 50S ribosomal protein L35 [Arachnia propionica]RRD06551.1 50S ribosomal protein L35 [Arachnia propionica]
MPKMKSHSGAKKRFKVTGSGKLMHRQANLGHLNAHKSSKRLRSLKGNTELAAADVKQAKALLAGHPGR